jgi:hypothetical protein
MCLYYNLNYIPLGISLIVVLLDHMVDLILVLWGSFILISTLVILICIPTNSVWGFLHLPLPDQHFLFVFLMIAILTRVSWNLNVVFMAMDVKHFFMVFFCPFVLFPLKMLCSVHLSISSLDHWFIESLAFWAPCKFWLLFSCQMYNWQRFSPILWAISSV